MRNDRNKLKTLRKRKRENYAGEYDGEFFWFRIRVSKDVRSTDANRSSKNFAKFLQESRRSAVSFATPSVRLVARAPSFGSIMHRGCG
ncbi:hypothetical protein Zmor_024890 [Zophobas morio]|uniref:Uncharacterized protein n=1 Tax=Zophobas morio TaxID=2755281 RepID=A0AA38HSV0_9CUCU|nr:hypothetical protein Zmor_024890 [Zophobas morio]